MSELHNIPLNAETVFNPEKIQREQQEAEAREIRENFQQQYEELRASSLNSYLADFYAEKLPLTMQVFREAAGRIAAKNSEKHNGKLVADPIAQAGHVYIDADNRAVNQTTLHLALLDGVMSNLKMAPNIVQVPHDLRGSYKEYAYMLDGVPWAEFVRWREQQAKGDSLSSGTIAFEAARIKNIKQRRFPKTKPYDIG